MGFEWCLLPWVGAADEKRVRKGPRSEAEEAMGVEVDLDRERCMGSENVLGV